MFVRRLARPALRIALAGLLAIVLAACQGQSRRPSTAGTRLHRLAHGTATAPATGPASEVVKVSKPTPIPPLGPDGRYLRVLPPGGARPVVPAGDAVKVALRHRDASNSGDATVAFGLLGNHPSWLVTFTGVCKGYGVPPGIVGTPCQLNTETVVVNATTGGWVMTYWGSVGSGNEGRSIG
jgi:hypothetical protein